MTDRSGVAATRFLGAGDVFSAGSDDAKAMPNISQTCKSA